VIRKRLSPDAEATVQFYRTGLSRTFDRLASANSDGPGVHDGHGRSNVITCFPPEYVPDLVRSAEIFSALLLHVTAFVAGGLESSAGTAAAFGHSHNHEHLHASGARCNAGGQQSSRRNGSPEAKSGMKKRGGKKAALAVPKDANSFRFRPRPSA